MITFFVLVCMVLFKSYYLAYEPALKPYEICLSTANFNNTHILSSLNEREEKERL